MGTCPICGFSENPADSIYCTDCGGKLAEAPQPKPQPQAEPPQPEPQPQAEPPQPEPQPQAEPPQPEPQQQPTTGGVLKLPDNSDIQVGESPKTIGRVELLDYLKTLQGVDPMVISRQHFTISLDKDTSYIEDGKTSFSAKGCKVIISFSVLPFIFSMIKKKSLLCVDSSRYFTIQF